MGNILDRTEIRPDDRPEDSLGDRPNNFIEVELKKWGRGCGFSIAGGIGNQYIPGDNGIYISKIRDEGAGPDLRIDVGDRIVSLKNYPGGEYVFDNCTHNKVSQ